MGKQSIDPASGCSCITDRSIALAVWSFDGVLVVKQRISHVCVQEI